MNDEYQTRQFFNMKKSELKQIIKEEIRKVLNENSVKNFKKGDEVEYINPSYHKEFKKDIEFFTNTPKNPNKPFEVYIKDRAIGKIVDIDNMKNIAYVMFDQKYFVRDSIRTDKSYAISYDYLKNI